MSAIVTRLAQRRLEPHAILVIGKTGAVVSLEMLQAGEDPRDQLVTRSKRLFPGQVARLVAIVEVESY
jgi:hypothetical protein